MSTSRSPWIRGLGAEATLPEVGGKGLHLAVMARAGLPVPDGYVVTTAAYRAFVAAHGLDAVIDAALAGLPREPAAADLQEASRRIRGAFGDLPWRDGLAADVEEAYTAPGCGAVAVRSSATAEDLPELSFAGQQDTFLGIDAIGALREAIVGCWSSLWTARALGYRARAGLAQEDLAVAVVVQRLVRADVAGVLFTADPLTGHRGHTSIDATFGLGEALVSGQVEPDHYLADSVTGRVLSRRRGSKAVATVSVPGGVESRARADTGEDTLDDALVARLVDLGARVQAVAGTPQDIEWALADSDLHLLQARPITSLFPLPPQADDALAAAGRAILTRAFPVLLVRFAPIMGPLLAAASALRARAGDGGAAVLELTRAAPHNVTTEMDLALWHVAVRIRADAAGRAALTDHSPADLAHAYLDGTLSPVAQDALRAFLHRYGMRGVGEVDVGRPGGARIPSRCWRRSPSMSGSPTPSAPPTSSSAAVDRQRWQPPTAGPPARYGPGPYAPSPVGPGR